EGVQQLRDGPAGRHLARVELREAAPWRNQDQERDAVRHRQATECVDAVPEAAALHQQRAARAPEIRAAEDADALLLPGELEYLDLGIGLAGADQPDQRRIRDVHDQSDAVRLESLVDDLAPGRSLRHDREV